METIPDDVANDTGAYYPLRRVDVTDGSEHRDEPVTGAEDRRQLPFLISGRIHGLTVAAVSAVSPPPECVHDHWQPGVADHPAVA